MDWAGVAGKILLSWVTGDLDMTTVGLSSLFSSTDVISGSGTCSEMVVDRLGIGTTVGKPAGVGIRTRELAIVLDVLLWLIAGFKGKAI